MPRKQPAEIIAMRKAGAKIVMLTAYDYPLAELLDQCGVDIILVGDSLANVVLGLESTTEIDIAAMIHHAKAVSRAVKNAMVVGDMPFASLHSSAEAALQDARRFCDEAGCDSVKIEWFEGCIPVVERIAAAGIPVMGHVGLTPQTADQLGGFRVQGREAEAALRIIEQARLLEAQGCFSMVLECVPDRLAGLITAQLKIPTIGIGAGVSCDGQVLVSYDLLGLFSRYRPKFVKQYCDAAALIKQGVERFRDEVRQGAFPDPAHSFRIKEEEWERLLRHVPGRPV